MTLTQQQLSPASILVVDDSPQSLRLLIDMLRPQGYKIRAASDGLQALSTARLEPPDLILLDVKMPGLSGYEVCEQLQQDDATRAIPVIFLSAADDILDKVRAFDAGGVDYITKPVQAEEVLARVETHLTLSRLLNESAQHNAQLQQEVAERKLAQEALQASEDFLQASLDALTAHIAVLDETGTILTVNRAWRRFAEENNLKWGDYGLGRDYLALCEAAAATSEEGALEAVTGIREVLAGQSERFQMEYPCHSPEAQRWFTLNVTRFQSNGNVRVVTAHEVITERKQAEINLVRLNQSLEQRLDEIFTLNLISQTLATVIDLPETLEIVAGTMTRLLDIYGTGIMLLDDAGTEMSLFAGFIRPVSASPLGPPQDGPGPIQTLDLTFPVSDDLLRRQVLQDGQALVIRQAQTNPLVAPAHQILQTHDIHGILLVPLVARAQVIGLIGLATDRAERDFTPREISLAETIAAHVAGAVEMARFLDLERQQRRLAESLRDAATGLSQSLDQATVLATIFEQLQQVLPHDSAAVLLHVDDSLVLADGANLAEGIIGYELPLTSAAPAVRVFQQMQPLTYAGGRSAPVEEIRKESKAKNSWLGVPLLIGQQAVGVLTIERVEPDTYSSDDQKILQAFAAHAALAIQNARLHEQVQGAATLEARNRLARELHDSVTQSLYSMTLHSDATLLALASGKVEVVEKHLHRLNRMTREAMAEMRLLIFEMRPPLLEEVGLAAALKARLEAVEARSGLGIEFKVEGDQPLAPATEAELYRVALEGLNNVVKHAQAGQVTVHLIFDVSSLRLTIQDNGIGFDLKSATRYGGYGLSTMKERVEKIHGTMTVNTTPGAGTRLEIEVKQ